MSKFLLLILLFSPTLFSQVFEKAPTTYKPEIKWLPKKKLLLLGKLKTTEGYEFVVARNENFIHIAYGGVNYLGTKYSTKAAHVFVKKLDEKGEIINKNFTIKLNENGTYTLTLINSDGTKTWASIKKEEVKKLMDHIKYFIAYINIAHYEMGLHRYKKTGKFVFLDTDSF